MFTYKYNCGIFWTSWQKNLTICFFTVHLVEEPQNPAAPADPKATRYGDVMEWAQTFVCVIAWMANKMTIEWKILGGCLSFLTKSDFGSGYIWLKQIKYIYCVCQ